MNYKDYNYNHHYTNDNDIYDDAINNTYKLLFNNWTLREMLEMGAKHFLVNPQKQEISIKLLESMMLYYEKEELYERCSIIKKVLDKYKKKSL